MKRFKRIIFNPLLYELICLSMGFYCTYLTNKYENGTFEYNIYLSCSVVLFTMAAITIMFENNEDTATGKIKNAFKSLLEGIVNIAVKIWELIIKAPINRFNSRGHLTVYEDNVYKIKNDKKKIIRKTYYKSWDKMNNTEKVRFLYYKNMVKHIKKGYSFEKSDTAEENRVRLEKLRIMPNGERCLFETYNKCRYDDTYSVDDARVNTIKKN